MASAPKFYIVNCCASMKNLKYLFLQKNKYSEQNIHSLIYLATCDLKFIYIFIIFSVHLNAVVIYNWCHCLVFMNGL